MSVLQDSYLYDDYCGEVLPARSQHARARELATKLGVPARTEPCAGLAETLCRVQGLNDCAGDDVFDSFVVRCGVNNPQKCRRAGEEVASWQQDPRRQHVYSPADRALLRRVASQRGTPRKRDALTCVERRGHRALCSSDNCFYRDGDCFPPVVSCGDDDARRVLLDALLRKQPNLLRLSGNARRRLEQHVAALSPAALCQVWPDFFPAAATPAVKGGAVARLNTLVGLVLDKKDTLTTSRLRAALEDVDVDLGPTADVFAAALNAIIAAVSTQAPWWFYFLAYPTGREAFQNMLSGGVSGELFKLSLLMTGMKGNFLFDDVNGLLDKIPVSQNPYIQTAASTITGILLRQLSGRFKKSTT